MPIFTVKMGIRDAHFWGCLYSLDTGREWGGGLCAVIRADHFKFASYGPVRTDPSVKVDVEIKNLSVLNNCFIQNNSSY